MRCVVSSFILALGWISLVPCIAASGDFVRVAAVAPTPIETGGPIISEFVADNSDFEDEFGATPDWIELYNGTPEAVDLAGWYLTDSPRNLTKWKISAMPLPPYGYRVVFASGRDRQLSPTRFAHSNFALSKSGGFVALVRPDGTTIASSYEYGPQEENAAFGEQGLERTRGYMYPASPGAVNSLPPAPASFAPDVQFSHAGGLIANPISLTLSTPGAPQAEIRYTIDRTEPRSSSPLFTSAISISRITTVKARAYLPGHLPGRISSRSFILIDSTLTDYAGTGKIFDSNLPLIFVDSFGANVDGTRIFRPSHTIVIAPDPVTGRATLETPPEYSGPSGIHVRGESSAGFDQRSYTLELWDERGDDKDESLLGMPSDSDWVLYGPWSEKTLMRNKLVFDWMLALRGNDGMAVRTRFVELFLNQTRPVSGRVGYSSYRGIYLLMEKLKRSNNRLPLAKLNEKTVDPELITGGYIIRKDKDDSGKNRWSTPRYSIPLQSYDPDRFNTNQLAYIRNYIAEFERALSGANFKNVTNGYQAYIDPDTFIDAQWMVEIAKQVDGYVFSTYFHKDRAGRLRAGPLWDFNIALGNADYGTGDRPTGWLYDNGNGAGQLWYPRLHADPEYKLAHWDRYWEMRRGIFATETVMATIDRHMATLLDGYAGLVSNRAPATIQNPVARHFRKWPRLGSRDWPNPPAETRIRTWQAEVEYMKDWIRPRLNWLDDQSMRAGRIVYRPPDMSHPGGMIDAPVELAMQPYFREDRLAQFPSGDIYYTTDNSDPRLPGGGISERARKYSHPVPIESSVTVHARLRVQNHWSPLATATFFFRAIPAAASNLVVSELLPRPAELSPTELQAGLVTDDGFEFVELRNIAREAVDLTGVKFTRGIEFDFAFARTSARLLKPGESVVLVADKRAFMLRYPQVPHPKIAGQFRGRLDGGGETIELQGHDGSVIQKFRFENERPWPFETDSTGRSLVLKTPATTPKLSDPASWVLSAKPGGTPAESGTGSHRFAGVPSDDTDEDGLADLFEFATGSDPENPASMLAPSAAILPFDVNGVRADYFTLTIHRRSNVEGVTLGIESSADLMSWVSAEPALRRVSSIEQPGGIVRETYRSLTPAENALAIFYRLKVKQE